MPGHGEENELAVFNRFHKGRHGNPYTQYPKGAFDNVELRPMKPLICSKCGARASLKTCPGKYRDLCRVCAVEADQETKTITISE